MLLLRKESFFRFNRVMLLLIMILSLLLPLVNIPDIAWGENNFSKYLNPHIEVGMPIAILEGKVNTRVEDTINWWRIIYIVYIIGVIVTAIAKFAQLIILNKKIHRGVLWTDKKDGVEIYCHCDATAPYSWFNKIVISNDDYENHSTEILKHEMGHIRNGHSWDIVLLNIVQILQWMNPLAWIMGISLRDVHEYEADNVVLISGVNLHQYQTLLIKKAIGASSYAFANGFNHSLLTKRITMMLRKKSNPWMRTKSLYLIIVAGIALSAFATPELNKQVSELTDKVSPSADKVNDFSANGNTFEQKKKKTVKTVQFTPPVIVKDNQAKNVIYIIDGKKVTYIDAQKINPNDIESINVFKDKSVTAAYGEKGKNGVIIIKTKNANHVNEVYEVVEQMPEFPGGINGLMDYLSKNVKYPVAAQECGAQGRIVVSFVVEKDGSVSNPKVVMSNADFINATPDLNVNGYGKIGDEEKAKEKKKNEEEIKNAKEALNAEAIRVITSMPNWAPGMNVGKPVRVKYNVPISFRLQ